MRADKMKVVLLISLMFTLALGEDYNKKPCQRAKRKDSYDIFLERHILQKNFDRNSEVEWKKYLEEKDLCNRSKQTFMEKKDQRRVEQICKGDGWLFKSNSNLCISGSPIDVYYLEVNNTNEKCKIKKPYSGPRYVVVACDAINNVCRPVHFQTSMKKDKDKRTVKCSA